MPTGTVATTVLVAVSITDTVSILEFTTYAVVIVEFVTMPKAPSPVVIVSEIMNSGRLIAYTEPESQGIKAS